MKLVLFDCDGTLVDSAAIIHACIERTFVEAGHPAPDLARTKSIIGLTLETALSRLLEREIDHSVSELAGVYRQHSATMRADPTVNEPFFDGVREIVDTLTSEDEILLGVVTGKSRRPLDILIEKHGLKSAIITSRTADECPSKPHPAMVLECCAETGVRPEQTIVVGDAIYDMQMARAAGASAIGVSWGYAGTDALFEAGAHHVVDEPQALLPLVMNRNQRDA